MARAFEWIALAQLSAVEGYLGDTLFGGASTPTERSEVTHHPTASNKMSTASPPRSISALSIKAS